MVLLLLGVIWAAVLVPPWLQNRREARPTASIRSFHRQLWLLGRASPGYAASIAPHARSAYGGSGSGVTVYGDDNDLDLDFEDDDAYAYDDPDLDDPELAAAARVNGARVASSARARVRVRARQVDGFYEPNGNAHGYAYAYEGDADGRNGHGRYERAGARAVDRAFVRYGAEPDGYDAVEGYDPDGYDDLDGFDDAGEYGDLRGFDHLDGMDPRVGARWADVVAARRQRMPERSPAEMRRRAEGYRRRRRVLSILLAAALVTAPPAAFLGGTMWWTAQLVADVMLVAYVSLLVQRQRRAIEREEKVHYLAPIRAPRPAVVVLHGGAAR